MELRAIMKLGDGKGSQLGEEDSPYIVIGQIQPLSTYSARDMRYYHTRHVVLPQGPTLLPQSIAVLPLARQKPGEALLHKATSGRTTGAMPLLALAVLPQGKVCLGWEGTDE